jgi:chitin synthase
VAVSEYGGYYQQNSHSRPGSTAGYPAGYAGGGGGFGNDKSMSMLHAQHPPMPNLLANTSRMSFAMSELPGGGGNNRVSQFGGSQFLGAAADMELANLAGLPSDDALLAEIREILRTADLMTVTKKGIKQELERRFGMPLDARKAYINSGKFHSPALCGKLRADHRPAATEALLSGQL